MDLFEILFILLFILFPVFEGLARRRRRSAEVPSSPGGEDESWQGDEEPGWSSAEAAEEEWREPEVGTAAEMLPDDLWEVLTGQRREGGSARSAPASDAPAGPAESLEYEGPEAYSLEEPAPAPIERPVPSAEARHRAFHELIDRPKRRVGGRTPALLEALRSPEGLRQAVLVKEILGPPKGLE